MSAKEPRGLLVRDAAVLDAAGIARIDAHWTGRKAEEIEPLVRSDLDAIAQGAVERYTCVGVIQDAVVAYGRCAFLRQYSGLPDGWYLIGLFVAPASRRRGIGQRLIQHRLDWLSRRTDTVYYFTAEDNLASIDVHSRFGFREVSRGLAVSPPGVAQGELPPNLQRPQVLFRKLLD